MNRGNFLHNCNNFFLFLRATSKEPGILSYWVTTFSQIEEGTLDNKFTLGNRSLRMEVRENRMTEDPVPIRPDRLEGTYVQITRKSYMYKYDLGLTLDMSCVSVVTLL